MKFYISSQCSGRKRMDRALEELAVLGYTRIELTGGTEWYPGLTEDLEQLQRRLSLDLMVHNYFPPQEREFVLNLAVVAPERREQMKTFVRDAVRLAKRLGNPVYGVHPGFRQDVSVEMENGFFKPGAASATGESAFYQMLDELDALAAAEGVKIAIENLAPRSREDRFSFLTDEADMDRFLAFVTGKEHLGLLLDFGHLGAASTLLDFPAHRLLDRIFQHPEKILELHLSENAGGRDVHGVNPADSWQLEYLKAHAGGLGDIPVVFEWQDAATSEVAGRFCDIVRGLQEI